MRKISIIILTLLISASLKAQFQSNVFQLKEGLNKFETSNIIKKGYEIIVITNDSLIIKKILELPVPYDCHPCYDIKNGKSIMFTFLSKHESIILSCCIYTERISIMVEN